MCKEKTIEKCEGIVAFLDVLGARKFDKAKAKSLVEFRDNFSEKLFDESKMAKERDENCPNIGVFDKCGTPIPRAALHRYWKEPQVSKTLTFGDSIIMTWALKRHQMANVYKYLPYVFWYLVPSVKLALEEKFLLRGGIAIGKYYVAENGFFGPAVRDAVEWHSATEWFGIVASPQAGYQLAKFVFEVNWGLNSYASVFLDYDVAVKGGKTAYLWTVAWPWEYYGPEGRERFQRHLAELGEIPFESYGKYQNTLKYFNYCFKKFEEKIGM